MSNKKISATLVALSAFVPNPFLIGDVLAQATAGDTMNLTAKVINPLVVDPSIVFKLNFKSFAIEGAGSYAIMPGGTGAITSGVTIGGATAATALLKVPQSASFTLSVPTFKTNSIFMTLSGGGVSSKIMTMKSLLFAGKSNIANATATLKNGVPSMAGMRVTNPAGSGRISAGARIFFGVNQAVGTYRGTFIVRITL